MTATEGVRDAPCASLCSGSDGLGHPLCLRAISESHEPKYICGGLWTARTTLLLVSTVLNSCMQGLLGCAKHGSFVFETPNVVQTYLRLVCWNPITMRSVSEASPVALIAKDISFNK
jgi:hypothetical protein